MKKDYNRPYFFAEEYSFCDSIASCEIQVGESESPDPILIHEKDSLCPVGDGGHYAGKNNANIPGSMYPLTLFNDGEKNDCLFDWSGGDVTSNGESYGDFGHAFYGATANNYNHRPAYKGKTFFS